jgi:hypothetical protein
MNDHSLLGSLVLLPRGKLLATVICLAEVLCLYLFKGGSKPLALDRFTSF